MDGPLLLICPNIVIIIILKNRKYDERDIACLTSKFVLYEYKS